MGELALDLSAIQLELLAFSYGLLVYIVEIAPYFPVFLSIAIEVIP